MTRSIQIGTAQTDSCRARKLPSLHLEASVAAATEAATNIECIDHQHAFCETYRPNKQFWRWPNPILFWSPVEDNVVMGGAGSAINEVTGSNIRYLVTCIKPRTARRLSGTWLTRGACYRKQVLTVTQSVSSKIQGDIPAERLRSHWTSRSIRLIEQLTPTNKSNIFKGL